MKLVEAYESLGYRVSNPRTAWSVEADRGICLSLWQDEIVKSDAGLMFDSRKNARPIKEWFDGPGKRRREKHIARAMKEFDGFVDVVILSGVTGKIVKSAAPWYPEKRCGVRWRVTCFDENSGHFCVEMKR